LLFRGLSAEPRAGHDKGTVVTLRYHRRNELLDQAVVRSLFYLHLSRERDVHPLIWAILMYLRLRGSVVDIFNKVGAAACG
jgi:hypothetical protein